MVVRCHGSATCFNLIWSCSESLGLCSQQRFSAGSHAVQGECVKEGSLTRKVTPADGSWSVVFPSQQGSTTPMLLAVGDGKKYTQKLDDIVFGDVLLFS